MRLKKKKSKVPTTEEILQNTVESEDITNNTGGKAVTATSITPLTQEVGEFKKGEETIEIDEATQFQRLCLNVNKALKSTEGTKLSCRLKVLTENKQAIVYQGMIGNVWARLKANGRHSVYRHALNNLLKANENTSKYFQ